MIWTICLIVYCYFLLRWLSGDQLFIVRLFNYFLPWLGLFLTICLIIVVSLRRKILAVVLVAPLIIIAIIYAPQFSGCLKTASSNTRTLKVMSYNIWRSNGIFRLLLLL